MTGGAEVRDTLPVFAGGEILHSLTGTPPSAYRNPWERRATVAGSTLLSGIGLGGGGTWLLMAKAGLPLAAAAGLGVPAGLLLAGYGAARVLARGKEKARRALLAEAFGVRLRPIPDPRPSGVLRERAGPLREGEGWVEVAWDDAGCVPFCPLWVGVEGVVAGWIWQNAAPLALAVPAGERSVHAGVENVACPPLRVVVPPGGRVRLLLGRRDRRVLYAPPLDRMLELRPAPEGAE